MCILSSGPWFLFFGDFIIIIHHLGRHRIFYLFFRDFNETYLDSKRQIRTINGRFEYPFLFINME